MKDINFLGQRIDKLSTQQKLDQKLFRSTVLFFAVVFIAFVVTLGVNIYFNSKLSNLKGQVEEVTRQITSSERLEADYLFFVDKLKIIKELFDKRASKQVVLEFFENLFGPGTTISGLTYNMEDGILSLEVSSYHVFFLEEAIETLEDPEIKDLFAALSKTDLNRRLDGEYSFNLTITFDPESELIIDEREY